MMLEEEGFRSLKMP